MRFATPEWLFAGALACAALCALMVWSGRLRSRSLERFVAARHAATLTRSLSPAKRRLKQVALLLGTALVFTALARPQWGYHEVKQHTRGIDLLFAIDTSKSMLAEDLRPSRLTRAKLAVEELLSKVEGDRLGLIAFAGDAFLQTPLTHDRTAFVQALGALEAGVIPVPGSDLASAIRVAHRAFASEGDHQKVLVLLTDGENLSGEALEAAREAKEQHLTIHTVGIGTKAGSLIPVPGRGGATEYLRDDEGELVKSELDEQTLRAIAASTSGRYYELGPSGQGLAQLHDEVLQKLEQRSLASTTKRVYHERFQWPLGLALALLLGEWLLREQKRERRRVGAKTALSSTLAAVAALTALSSEALARDAAPVDAYNQAAESYRSGDFDAARESYRRALNTPDLELQQRAYYDLGNSLYRLGAAASEKERSQTIARYREALEAYEAALRLDGRDEDARFNRDFVKGKLEQLEQEQEDEEQRNGEGQQQQQQPNEGAKGQAESEGAKQGSGDSERAQGSPASDGSEAQGDGSSGNGKSSTQGSQAGAERDGRQATEPKEGAGPGAGERDGAKSAEVQPDPSQDSRAEANGAKPEGGVEPQSAARRTPQAEADERASGRGQGELDPTSEEGAAAQAAHEGAPAGAAQEQAALPSGALTKEQAERLLDGLAGELRRLPSGFAAGARHPASPNDFRKDW